MMNKFGDLDAHKKALTVFGKGVLIVAAIFGVIAVGVQFPVVFVSALVVVFLLCIYGLVYERFLIENNHESALEHDAQRTRETFGTDHDEH